MRFSVALLAVAAVGAHALPESYAVQPITQISDGQIQAPPATATASYATPPAEVPVVTESSVPEYTATVSASITEAPITPSTTVVVEPSAPVVNSSIVVVAPSSPPSNGTVSTGAPTAPSSSAAEPSESSPSETTPGAPEATGAGAVNMVSLVGLTLAVAAMVFA